VRPAIYAVYSATGGQLIAPAVVSEGVAVTDGRFTLELDFGPGVFDGDPRWLEIAARHPAGSGEYVTLSPRQQLMAAPYAHFALGAQWSGLGDIPVDLADGDDNTTYTAGSGLHLSATQFNVVFAGSGSSASAARADHDHDAAYVSEDQPASVSAGILDNSDDSDLG